jgi:hypothetical protein
MRFIRYGFCAFVFLTGCNAIFGLTPGEPGQPSGGPGGSGGAGTSGTGGSGVTGTGGSATSVTATSAGGSGGTGSTSIASSSSGQAGAGMGGGGVGGGSTGGGGTGGGPVFTFGPEQQVASNQQSPRGVAADATHVYWVNMGDGTVRRRPKTLMGNIEEIANGQGQPSVIALHPFLNQVYWATYSPLKILRAPSAGGNVTPVYEPNWLANAEGLVVTDNHLFWTNDSTEFSEPMFEMVGRVDNTFATSYAPLAENQAEPRGIAYHDGFIYWTSITASAVRRIAYNAAPGTMSQLVHGGGKEPYAVAADDTHVYWGEHQAAIVARLPHTAYMTIPETIGPDEGQVNAMAIDGSYVYWCNAAGGVKAWRKDGSGVISIAADSTGNCEAIAVDDDGVYWSDTFGGRVLMVRKL